MDLCYGHQQLPTLLSRLAVQPFLGCIGPYSNYGAMRSYYYKIKKTISRKQKIYLPKSLQVIFSATNAYY